MITLPYAILLAAGLFAGILLFVELGHQLTVYVILDFEYPRVGFIRVDAFDQVLVDVRASMEGK